MSQLTFVPPDTQRFPCLRLAYEALREGGVAPALLNAANEVAVDAFLKRKIGFMQIPAVIEAVLERAASATAQTLDDVFAADVQGRVSAKEWVQKYGVVV
jgi:1-deoxy-D-xylulose-5-phosphate reductoisomerase